jgi:hypothetical protein
VKYWEIIADNLSKAGGSWGSVSAVDSQGRTIWIVDAHRDGKRLIVRADENLTAFTELESAIRECGELACLRRRDLRSIRKSKAQTVQAPARKSTGLLPRSRLFKQQQNRHLRKTAYENKNSPKDIP